MPRLWTETIDAHRREVREAVLDAVAVIATERGFGAVTMTQIAEQAGIGRATLYKYFPDVPAVLRAWHDRHVTRHLDYLASVRDQATDPDERLAAVLDAVARIAHESRRHHGTEVAAYLHADARVAQAHDRLRTLVGDVIADAAAAGRVRADVPPGELAAFCVHALAAAGDLTSRTAVRRLVGVTLAGLRPTPEPGGSSRA